MAQARKIEIRTRESGATVHLDMEPTGVEHTVELTIRSQVFTPAELRVVARLLEQAADRKEDLFTVVGFEGVVGGRS